MNRIICKYTAKHWNITEIGLCLLQQLQLRFCGTHNSSRPRIIWIEPQRNEPNRIKCVSRKNQDVKLTACSSVDVIYFCFFLSSFCARWKMKRESENCVTSAMLWHKQLLSVSIRCFCSVFVLECELLYSMHLINWFLTLSSSKTPTSYESFCAFLSLYVQFLLE